MIGIVQSFFKYFGADIFGYLPLLTGVNEASLKLLVSILFAYLIGAFYDTNLRFGSKSEKRIFIIITGLDLLIFNFGSQAYHTLVVILSFFISMKLFGAGKFHTIFSFAFMWSYLLLGYYHTESENYDINWTMPVCILLLRLGGLAFDLWDGNAPTFQLSKSFRSTALKKKPGLMHLAAFCLFPGYLLVGPQLPMSKFNNFIDGKNDVQRKHVEAAEKCLLLGSVYLTLHLILTSYFYSDYLISEEFKKCSFLYKHFYIGLWGRAVLVKYISIWLFAEAACNRFRISYNDETKKWDLCKNVKIAKFELATRFGHYIDGFNVNTNTWAAQYVYKRCAFLGNKHISQAITLFYLAIWHGLYSGYYATFAMEYLIMYFEKETQHILEKYALYHRLWQNEIISKILFVILKAYTLVFMGWCMIPFVFKSIDKWWAVYKALNFSGFVFFISGIVINLIIENHTEVMEHDRIILARIHSPQPSTSK